MKYNIRVLKTKNFADIETASKFLNKRILVGDNFEKFDCKVVFLKEIKINSINKCFIDHYENEYDEIAIVDSIEL